MTEDKCTGIILRTQVRTESSLVVHWLTPERGRISTIAKGARRPKSAFSGRLDLYFSANFTIKPAIRGDLHTLLEVESTEIRRRLRTDYGALKRAAYGVALIEQMTERETPLPEAHHLLTGFLDYLDAAPSLPRAIFAFEIRLLASMGLDLGSASDASGWIALVNILRDCPWSELNLLAPPPDDVRDLQSQLRRSLLEHCEKFPRGRAEVLKLDSNS